jgi:hypothetical protein
MEDATMGSPNSFANRTLGGLCALALLSSVAFSQTAGPASTDSSHPSEDATSDKVVHLQKFEVTGRPTMGIKAGIACEHMLIGKVVQVVVKEVTKDGRGDKLGICVGDEIVAINGETLIGKQRGDVYALMEQMSQARLGSIDLRRQGLAETLHRAWELIPPK